MQLYVGVMFPQARFFVLTVMRELRPSNKLTKKSGWILRHPPHVLLNCRYVYLAFIRSAVRGPDRPGAWGLRH